MRTSPSPGKCDWSYRWYALNLREQEVTDRLAAAMSRFVEAKEVFPRKARNKDKF
jgi:hypothetical protein